MFFTFPVPFSVSMAGAIRVGNLLGAGNGAQGLTVTKLTLGSTNGVMLTTAVLVLIFRDKIPYSECSDICDDCPATAIKPGRDRWGWLAPLLVSIRW